MELIVLLAAGAGCTHSIELVNAGTRAAAVELEAHTGSGALAALPAGGLTLAPGTRRSYALEGVAWVKVRERIPLPGQGPVVAARGITECRDGDRLQTATGEASYPMRNPWFAGDTSPPAGIIQMVNAADQPAYASGCYSSGNVYSLPGTGRAPAVFQPVCSETFEVQVPPFGTREFPVERNGSRWFGLKTRGPSIVLQMLKPAGEGVRMFVVDSSIRFEGEVTSR